MNIRLCIMTKELCRRYHQGFIHDPAMFMEQDKITTYVYSQAHADSHWQRQQDLGRVHLAVMLDDAPIGEIVLKNIDQVKGCCTMGIHLQNDSCKNKGYGTDAELQTLEYAFGTMGLQRVYADALLKNARSRHVLEKVGFRETNRDDTFIYYVCEKSAREHPEGTA